MRKRIVLKYQRSLNNRHSKGEKIMVGIVLASHGGFADGIFQSAEIGFLVKQEKSCTCYFKA